MRDASPERRWEMSASSGKRVWAQQPVSGLQRSDHGAFCVFVHLPSSLFFPPFHVYFVSSPRACPSLHPHSSPSPAPDRSPAELSEGPGGHLAGSEDEPAVFCRVKGISLELGEVLLAGMWSHSNTAAGALEEESSGAEPQHASLSQGLLCWFTRTAPLPPRLRPGGLGR